MALQWLCGVDCGGQEHSACFSDLSGKPLLRKTLRHATGELYHFAQELSKRGPGVVVIEGRRGLSAALERALEEAGVSCVQADPARLRRFRDEVLAQANKTDLDDAQAALEYGRMLADRLRLLPCQAEDEVVLRALSRQRDQLEAQRITALQHLRECLRQYAPEALSERVFFHLDCQSALALWERYPLPGQWRRLGEKRLRAFLARYAAKGAGARAHKLVGLARQHRPGLADEALAASVSLWAAQVSLLQRQVAEIEIRMEQAEANHSPAQLLGQIPGLSTITIAALLGEMGEVVAHGERAVAAYSGLGGKVHQTGTTLNTQRRRRRVNRRLKRAFMDLAWHLVQNQAEGAAFYARRRAKGRTHWQALRSLARQMIRIVVRMLNQGESFRRPERGPYLPEELKHLRGKQERERFMVSGAEPYLAEEKSSPQPLTRSGRVHRDPGGDSLSGFRQGPRESAHRQLPVKPETNGYSYSHVCAGL